MLLENTWAFVYENARPNKGPAKYLIASTARHRPREHSPIADCGGFAARFSASESESREEGMGENSKEKREIPQNRKPTKKGESPEVTSRSHTQDQRTRTRKAHRPTDEPKSTARPRWPMDMQIEKSKEGKSAHSTNLLLLAVCYF